jgi:hypothetical protein
MLNSVDTVGPWDKINEEWENEKIEGMRKKLKNIILKGSE